RFRGPGEPALGDQPRRAVQVSAARVVAEPAPEPQHRFLARTGEGLHGGKALKEALVVRDDGRDLRLLEHHLREPDAVRIARALPRQVVAAMGALPVDELAGERDGNRCLTPISDYIRRLMAAFILRRLGQAILV